MYQCGVRDIERGQLSDISPDYWQNDTSVAKNSWCFAENNDYKKPEEIISCLIDVVSKNGSLLLNVGPKRMALCRKKDIELLNALGEWMDINGEGIYETSFWKKSGEGPTVTEEGHLQMYWNIVLHRKISDLHIKNGCIFCLFNEMAGGRSSED